MDRSIYVAMTGAGQTVRALASLSHNIANASTVGFRAQLGAVAGVPVLGEGLATRVNAVQGSGGVDFSPGPQIATGRDLDIAIQGEGWIAVQGPDGREGYTRAGELSVRPDGLLVTADGLLVLGDAGPLDIPAFTKIDIGHDGTISVVPQGQGPETIASVGRIRLVAPANDDLVRGADGLMRMADGSDAPADASVRLISGALEGSNINPADGLAQMIALSRQFEMHVRAIQAADENAEAATRLLGR